MEYKTFSINRKLLFGIFYIFIAIFLLQLVSATGEEYKPYLHKPNVGEYPKLEMYGTYKTELFPGSATYSYNLVVPKGINDFSPEISITYNSQSAFSNPSIIGAGWTISSDYIFRNINYTINNTNDDYFILTINGNSQKFFNKNGTYKTETESYLRIENKSDNGKDYWIITSKDGTKFRFGYNNDSLLASNNGFNYNSKWFLDSIEEIHGNHIYYSYLKNPYSDDQGAVYLSNITYNNDRLRRIYLVYENQTRPDKRLIYDQGIKFLESRRLIGIYVYFNQSLVRRYNLEYVDSNNEKTLTSLSKIYFIGSDNSSVLNSASFEYYDSQPGFDNSQNWLVPEEFASISLGSKDLGLRLIDVNNDGFADLIKSNGSVNYTKLNDKNSSWQSTSLFSVPVQIVDSSNVYQGVEFVDINHDGFVDILKSKAGTRLVYVNNGSNWNLNNNWTIPVDIVNSSGDDQGVRFIDINGDGFVEIILSNLSTSKVWLNNGTGWNLTSWNVPYYFIDSSGKDTGLREIDFNSDGLTDLILGGTPGNAWINNGSGWENATSYSPNLTFTDYANNNPDLGVRFMDINGDGLVDVLQNIYNNASFLNQTCFNITNSTQNCTTYIVTNLTNVKINNGSGWVYNPSWQSPESFTYYGYNIGRRIADVNGDGYPDIIVGHGNNTFERKTYLRSARSSFLLKKIINEYGGVTLISYDQSSIKDNGQNLGFNLWIINNVTLNNSLSGSFGLNPKYYYDYFGGKYDYKNYEFLGFNIVNETLDDGTLIIHYFNQDTLLKGTEYLTKSLDKNGTHYKDNENQFVSTIDNRILLNSSSVYNYEGNSNAIISNITYKYDNYGNVLFINYTGNIAVVGDEKYEEYNYVYNTTNYIVNKISNYSLYNSSLNVVKKYWNYYDNLSNEILKGDLTKVMLYNDRGQNIITNYTYDNYGNIIKKTDANGNNESYTYDIETNTFLIKKTNALGHMTNYYYDKGTGNLLYEEKDRIYKNYTYDVFGRNLKEIMPLDSESYPTKNNTYYLDGVAPEKIRIQTKNNDSYYSESWYYYDGFSNPVQIKLKYDNSTQIVKNFEYDGKFRINKEQDPYFASYSPEMEMSYNTLGVNYQYDGLDRVINLNKSDNSSIKIIFNNTKVTSVNENGILIEYNLDAYYRITNVLEHNRNSSGIDEVYNTSYYYDTSNNLIKINDSQGNIFLFVYDSLGRRIYIDDPNMEKWTYIYDSNGNIINQTDGRNISIILSYDKLNRLINKTSGNLLISFEYDRQYNGTLFAINYTNIILDPLRYEYVYDNRLRIFQEKLYLDYTPGGADGGKNYWINTSIEYDSSDKILKKYLPNVSYNYHSETGVNITTPVSFPNSTLIYNYNYIGKIKKINNFVNNYEYNSLGNVINKTYSNNIETNYDYDKLNRLISIKTPNIQNLTYSYDLVSNIKQINDSKNSRLYQMSYDDLDRLNSTMIHDYKNYDHERLIYKYDKIGNILYSLNDQYEMNYFYNSSRVHAPYFINKSVRSLPQIELSIIDPIASKTINQSQTFNFTTQVCCKDNDCWGINVSLDPEGHSYAPTSETLCQDGFCTMTIYPETRFVYEEDIWKKIEEAKSLKDVWAIKINEDPNFPVKVIDYNYSSVILSLSVSQNKLNKNIPLKVYNKHNNSELPKDKDGNPINKNKILKINELNSYEQVTIDMSDTSESLLSQEIKWGENSTEITFIDNNSINMDDTYIYEGDSTSVHGSENTLNIKDGSGSKKEILIRYNISQIPKEAVIDNANLNLYLSHNNLISNEYLNISLFNLNQSFSWNEETANWLNSHLQTGNYYPSIYDTKQINNSDINKYISWNIAPIVKNKNKNESFYLNLTASNNNHEIWFYSKEIGGQSSNPYLNITYRLKGLVSTTIGETPFYTTITNPYFVDLEQNQCQNITWLVNATGNPNDYIFFTYANLFSNKDLEYKSSYINITIYGASQIPPNDTHKFYHKDSSGNPVAWLGNSGNIILKGKCFFNTSCDTPGDDSFIIRNSTNNNVAYINSTGDLCIEKGDCSGESANCNGPADGAFIMANSTSYVSYIDGNGELCLTGKLYENSNP